MTKHQNHLWLDKNYRMLVPVPWDINSLGMGSSWCPASCGNHWFERDHPSLEKGCSRLLSVYLEVLSWLWSTVYPAVNFPFSQTPSKSEHVILEEPMEVCRPLDQCASTVCISSWRGCRFAGSLATQPPFASIPVPMETDCWGWGGRGNWAWCYLYPVFGNLRSVSMGTTRERGW